MTEWIGYCAAVLTTACYFPQAFHVLRTRETRGISLLAYSALFLGVTCWALYGVCLGSWPLMLANGITLPVIATILVLKIRHG